jgi:HAD superfamily hydrolase (TIGR01549 family)
MPIKAVLFDMFDTLMLIEKNHEFYSPSLLRMYRYLRARGIDVSFETFNVAYIRERDALYAKADLNFEEPHFNVRVSKALQSLGYNYQDTDPLVAAATNEFCLEFMTYVRIDEHAKSLLVALRKKYKLGLVSNFAIPECVLELLRINHLDCLFDVIIVSAAVNKRKPSPEIFQTALKDLKVPASQAVFVGDTVDADVEGPKSVGMKVIYIERRIQKPSEKYLPDQTIKSLSELPPLLELY